MEYTRRGFLAAAPGACAVAGLLGAGSSSREAAADDESTAGTEAARPEFPRQATERVREMVGVCHRDIDRVRVLLDEQPALVNAAWDWGFGDWETALGAAAHTGRRNIAELLLERGARLDIFAAAMLGQTETVRAMIAAAPGIQRNAGPHGITLLAHARAGGDEAADMRAFLEALGDADTRPKTEPLNDELRRAYLGRFASSAIGERFIDIGDNRNGDLTLAVGGQFPIVLRHAGEHAFFPSGAPAVRIAFTNDGAGMNALSIVDGASVLTASRIPRSGS